MLMLLIVGAGSLGSMPAMARKNSAYSIDFNKSNYTQKL